MKVKDFVRREVDAIKRDREYDRNHQGVVGYSMQEVIDRLDEYPSLVTRFERALGSLYRAKTSVREFPYTVKYFVHRGRHGWATPDTWSMDYTLAKQLDGVFREFVKVSSDLIDYEQDTTDKIALEIADGFRAYWQYQEREWEVQFDVEESKRQFEEAHDKVRHSCLLMAKHWPSFWW